MFVGKIMAILKCLMFAFANIFFLNIEMLQTNGPQKISDPLNEFGPPPPLPSTNPPPLLSNTQHTSHFIDPQSFSHSEKDDEFFGVKSRRWSNSSSSSTGCIIYPELRELGLYLRDPNTLFTLHKKYTILNTNKWINKSYALFFDACLCKH